MPPGIKPIKAKPSDTSIPPTTTVPYNSPRPGVGIGTTTPTTMPQSQIVAPTTTAAYNSPRPGVTVGGTVLGPQVPDWSKIPGAKETKGMSPDVLTAQRDLKIQQTKALRAGIPPATVENIAAGNQENGAIKFLGKVINFDVLGKVPGTNIDLPGSFKPAATILGPLSKLDVGRRAILSTLKEVGDVGAGLRGNQAMEVTAGTSGKTGFNFSDWLKQTNDLTIGYGKLVPSPTGNKWVDRLIGFAGDVALDPLTYVSGPGGIAKTVEEKAAISGAIKLEEKAQARTLALIARDVAADTARQAEKEVARIAADATATAAEKATAKRAAEIFGQAEKEATSALKKATGKVAAEAPRRTYGAGAREALAEQARLIRQEAQQVLVDETASVAEKTTAQAAVNALTDEVILKINEQGYAGIRGAAAEVLGTQGGLRFFNPASVFGVGPSRFIIPGTEQLTNLGGRAVAGTRLGLVATPFGQRILNNITPLGEGGMIGADEIYRMRVGLRGGKVLDSETGLLRKITAQEASDFTTLLSVDKYNRGVLDLARKEAAATVGTVTTKAKFKKVLSTINEHLQIPEGQWKANGLRDLTAEERAAYDAVKTVMEKFRAQKNSAAALVGAGRLTPSETFFPITQSKEALQWAAEGGPAAIDAKISRLTERFSLGYIDKTEFEKQLANITQGVTDKTWVLGDFTERALTPGKTWFGKVLDGTESIRDLNQIAKDSGLIDFNFFEEDLNKALNQYANNHAKYLAYSTTFSKLPTKSPETLGGFAQDLSVARATTPPIFGTAAKPGTYNLSALEKTIENFMGPGKITNWSERQILDVKTKVDDLAAKLSGTDVLDKEAFNEALTTISQRIEDTNRLILAGKLDPTVGALTTDELNNYVLALENQLSNIRGNFVLSEPSRWKAVGKIVKDGFEELNKSVIPDVAVRKDIADIFKNVRRLEDPAIAKLAENVLKDYNTFFKSYSTLSIGFQVRNALGNTFMMFAAGANPNNLIKGYKIYDAWKTFLKDFEAKTVGTTTRPLTGVFKPTFAETKTVLEDGIKQFLDESVASGLIKESERDAVRKALAYSGATGRGQIGEIATVAGTETPGVLGREATGKLPFAGKTIPGTNLTIPETSSALAKKASEKLGIPITKSRNVGSAIEDYNRFQLMLDGLFKGFDEQTSVARTVKYLFDYNDVTKLDKYFRQLRPFWLWTSRNLPLQVENMWMNPRAYAWYNSFKRNLEDKSGTSPYLPQYYKEQGAFKLPFGKDIYTAPELGFPGAGKPGLIQEIISPKQFLSSLTPPVRGLLEILSKDGEKFFSGAPVVSKGAVNPQAEKLAYYLREVSPPAGFFKRIASATPLRRAEILQQILGITPPTTGEDPASKELQSILSFLGSPVFKLRPAQEKSEIWRRFFQLQDEIDRAKARAKADKKK